MKGKIVKDPRRYIKQYVLEHFDEIFPFAILDETQIQVRIPFEEFDKLPSGQQDHLKKGSGFGSTQMRNYNEWCAYFSVKSYIIYPNVANMLPYDGIWSKNKFYVFRDDLQPFLKEWIEKGWF